MSSSSIQQILGTDSFRDIVSKVNAVILLSEALKQAISTPEDIRALVNNLSARLNAVADCDDETLDQLSEIVEYIKSNKELIEALTTRCVGRKTKQGGEIFNNYEDNQAGSMSSASGNGTKAISENQHVHGKYNVEDTENKYVSIVGNGSASEPSNAHTLDWDGNAWYKSLSIGGTFDAPKVNLTYEEDLHRLVISVN